MFSLGCFFFFDSSSPECFIATFFFNVPFSCTRLFFYSAFIIFQSRITHQLQKKNVCVLISAPLSLMVLCDIGTLGNRGLLVLLVSSL